MVLVKYLWYRLCLSAGNEQNVAFCLCFSSTFWRESPRESFCVNAIVVNHVIHLHPHQPLQAWCIQLFCQPWIGIAGISLGGPNASLCTKVPMGSDERSFGPICFDKTASCCPLISIPYTWKNSHRLPLGEWNFSWIQVLELSNRGTINIEAEICMQSEKKGWKERKPNRVIHYEIKVIFVEKYTI